jgi:hypothetical protein
LILEEDDHEPEEGIWEEHVAALHAFLSVATQWRIVAPGDGTLRRTGLDYAGVRVDLENAGVEVTPALWSDIKLIEAGAIAAGNEETFP